MIFIKKIDKILLISTCILIIFGVIMVYSSSNVWAVYKFNDPYKYVRSQFIFFCIGLIAIYIIIHISPSYLEKYSNHFLLLCMILLILVLIVLQNSLSKVCMQLIE